MNSIQEITEIVSLLPEFEQNLVYEMVKRLVPSKDNDYLTITEVSEIKTAEKRIASGEFDTLDSLMKKFKDDY